MRLLGKQILVKPILRELTEKETQDDALLVKTESGLLENVRREAQLQSEGEIMQLGEEVDSSFQLEVGQRIVYEFNDQTLKYLLGEQVIVLYPLDIIGVYTEEEKAEIEADQLANKEFIKEQTRLQAEKLALDKKGGPSIKLN